MSWAAIVSGKARHTTPNSPSPIVASVPPSATTTVTIDPIPPPTSAPNGGPARTAPALLASHPHDPLSLPPAASAHPLSPDSSARPADSDSLNPPQDSNTRTATPNPNPTAPHNRNPASRNTPNPAPQNASHQRSRNHNKHKNHKKHYHYHQTPQSPQSKNHHPHSHLSPSQQSPQPHSHKHKIYNQSMWNDPRIVAIYRLWTHHISTFMAQPVPFFHFFVVNAPFRQSVFEAGLTFHPDTDPANPVLINLNSSRFGMAERISALSPPAGLDTRSANRPATPTPTTSAAQQLSPLSEPSQPPPPLQPPASPGFLIPNVNTVYEPLKAAHTAVPNGDGVIHFEGLTNGVHSVDAFEGMAVPDANQSYDETLAKAFADGMRFDVSDSESERLSEGDATVPNGVKSHPAVPYDGARNAPLTPRRRNGRGRVVSRVLDIRIPPNPICKTQSDKAKVEFIEQIEDIFPKITPPSDYSEVRADLLARLRKIISREWEGAGIDVYGSAGNGLGLRSADVDMSLYMPEEVAAAHGREKGKPDSPKVILGRLATIMQENNMGILSKFLDARVPVIKMQDPVSKLQVDVCVNNILAVRNTELLKAYVDLDERFRYVCILVKLWAKKRDLNDAYHGTLSSYAYTLLVIHYMQTLQTPVLPCLQQMVNGKRVPAGAKLPTEMTDNGNQKLYNTYFDRSVTPETFRSANTQPVHELLMGFFRYYAYTFKYRTDLASIRLGVKTARAARGWDESTVYEEWEAKQAQYRAALDAAKAALEARRKADAEEKRLRAKGQGNSGSGKAAGADANGRRERIQFPRRPRLASKHLFCIEDPFDIDHDLSRGMEKAAVSVIRQEMMRAYELIAETGDFKTVCEEYR